jgi:hypothetical protein
MKKEFLSKFKSLTPSGLLARVFSLLYLVMFIFIPGILLILNAKNAGGDERNLSEFQIVGIIFLCVYFVGLITGFFKDSLGGIISILPIIFFVIYTLIRGDIGEETWGEFFYLSFAAIPSILYLHSWYLIRKRKPGI